MTGYSLTFVPFSWVVGIQHKTYKTLYAFGPFRFVIHRGLPSWKDGV